MPKTLTLYSVNCRCKCQNKMSQTRQIDKKTLNRCQPVLNKRKPKRESLSVSISPWFGASVFLFSQ